MESSAIARQGQLKATKGLGHTQVPTIVRRVNHLRLG